jgi:hypothetical protein
MSFNAFRYHEQDLPHPMIALSCTELPALKSCPCDLFVYDLNHPGYGIQAVAAKISSNTQCVLKLPDLYWPVSALHVLVQYSRSTGTAIVAGTAGLYPAVAYRLKPQPRSLLDLEAE